MPPTTRRVIGPSDGPSIGTALLKGWCKAFTRVSQASILFASQAQIATVHDLVGSPSTAYGGVFWPQR